MAGDRSLDEFLGGDESADPDSADGEPEEGETPAEPPEPAEDDAIEPMAETFAWSPDGGECAVCGATVEERWHDDGLVCADCKAW